MSERAVVIGSGVAGLTAAVTLAILGREVTVVERAPRPAPLLSGFDRGEQFCDVGLHYTGGLQPGGLLHRLLDRFGVLDMVEPVALCGDGFDRLLFTALDLELVIPCGMQSAEEVLCRTFPRSRRAILAWASALRQSLSETPLLNPELPPSQWAASPFDMISLTEFILSHGGEPRLIEVLGRYGEMLYGMSANEVPLSTHAVVIGSYLQSVHAVRGGGRSLAAALLNAADRFGVVVKGDCEVREICVDDRGAVSGVRLAGGDSLTAGTVVFTPHPAQLPALLSSGRTGDAYRRRLERTSNTPAMFLAFLDAENDELPDNQNVSVFSPKAEPETHGVVAVMAGSPPAPGRRRTRCLITPAELGDFGQSDPAGRSRPAGYRQVKAGMTKVSLEQVGRHVPSLASSAVIRETLSPWSFRDWTGSDEGSAYGLKRTVSGYRLRSRTPLQGLFLAGQSLLAPGIMGAAASALVACCNSAGADQTWQALFECTSAGL